MPTEFSERGRVSKRGRAPRSATILGPLLALGLLACGPGDSDGDPASATSGHAESERSASTDDSTPLATRVRDIAAIFRPPPADTTSDRTDLYLEQRRTTLRKMESASPELGRALFDYIEEHPGLDNVQRRDLLEAGSLALGVEASDELIELISKFEGNRLGSDLGLRGRAAEVLGHVAPDRAVEVLAELLTTEQRVTLPSPEKLLEGYLAGAQRLELDPTEVLMDVATDLFTSDAARHMAVKRMGDYPGPLTRAALVEVLTESTGNAYLRRLAAQSIARALPKDEAIQTLQDVLEIEADSRMQTFLANMLDQLIG